MYNTAFDINIKWRYGKTHGPCCTEKHLWRSVLRRVKINSVHWDSPPASPHLVRTKLRCREDKLYSIGTMCCCHSNASVCHLSLVLIFMPCVIESWLLLSHQFTATENLTCLQINGMTCSGCNKIWCRCVITFCPILLLVKSKASCTLHSHLPKAVG